MAVCPFFPQKVLDLISMDNRPLRLSIENLVVDRGLKRVLNGMTFSVNKGEAVVLVGPNGSGKTTLLRTLAGLLKPVSGSLTFTEEDQKVSADTLIHYIGHLNALKDHLTVEENLTFWAQFLRSSSSETLLPALQSFDLENLRAVPVGYLSAGQKRRACLARLLVTPRPIWLLDEPTVSLDTRAVGLLVQKIETHLQSGGLLLAATHVPLGISKEKMFQIESGRGAFA